MSDELLQRIEALEDLLAQEHEALLRADAEALAAVCTRKQAAADALQALQPQALDDTLRQRLQQLRMHNQDNAALLGAAQSMALWTLQRLGRLNLPTTYAASGHWNQAQSLHRPLGAA